MPAALTLRGPFRGYSGHDRTIRHFARQLVAAGVEVGLVDLPGWTPHKLAAAQRDPWFDALARPVAAVTTVHFCMPHQVRPVPGQLDVNYTMFEADRVSADWVARGRRHDLLVLPTESSRQAWLASGFAEARIRLCPLGVDSDAFRPGLEPLALPDQRGRSIADYAVRVLTVAEVVPRKNLLGLLRLWLRATCADDDAILILKLSADRPTLMRLVGEIARLEQAIGRRRAEAAPILLLTRVLSDAELPRLYASASHYLSLSCGEGWDLAMSEAAASGLQLIAPDHSAYRAYLDERIAWLIPARAAPAEAPGDPALLALFAGARWWQPDEAVAAGQLRRVLAGEVRPSARQRMVERFSWQAATARLIEILDELQETGGRPA
jgi:glycosyltransferase involved in cell wall biosynthesis